MKNWIYISVFVGGLVTGLLVGFLLSNQLVTKTIVKSYERQAIKQNELVVTLAKVPKYLIENSLTVRKVKRGSTISYVPSSDIQAFELKAGIDSLVNTMHSVKDTITPEKTFWQKLKFW